MEPTANPAELASQAGGGLSIPDLIDNSGFVVYTAVALLAIWGTYNAILLYRSLAKKSLPNNEAEALLGKVRELVARNNFQGAIEACMSPPHWHSALAQLLGIGLKNRHKGLSKVRQRMVMEFHSEVVSPLESRVGSLGAASRMGPLLGLVGTVLSMIAAFGRMAQAGKPDPIELAGSISLGLWTTAGGLLIAVPLMCLGNDVLNRLRRLRDRTEKQLQDFIEVLEQSEAQAPPPRGNRPVARGATR